MNNNWKESTHGHYWTWYEARSFEDDTWVLPTLQQLRESHSNNTEGFFKECYWTCEHEVSGHVATFFNYSTGKQHYGLKTKKHCVRLVRRQR